MTVLPEDRDQPLVVSLSYSSGASGKWQVPHWDVGYDVHLEQEVNSPQIPALYAETEGIPNISTYCKIHSIILIW